VVADVAVGPHQILRCAVDAEASERPAVEIVYRSQRGFTSQLVGGEENAGLTRPPPRRSLGTRRGP
jgi:hypothetical protein